MKIILEDQELLEILRTMPLPAYLCPIGQSLAELDFKKNDVGEYDVILIFEPISNSNDIERQPSEVDDSDEAGSL